MLKFFPNICVALGSIPSISGVESGEEKANSTKREEFKKSPGLAVKYAKTFHDP